MRFFFLSLAFIFVFSESTAQTFSDTRIEKIIQSYKEDVRGPYRDIKWFCEDGSVREARDPCPDNMEGHQHARYKELTITLHEQEELYFGQILTGLENADFWSWERDYSPIKQYMLIKYLESVDDGWIRRKAQYYRGSIQSEDELEWAKDFFQWVLSSDVRVDNNFLLIRQAAKVIPHQSETQIGNKVRILSKVIADDYNPFMALRTKIHSTPEVTDISAVEDFMEEHKGDLTKQQLELLDELLKEMDAMFKPVEISDLAKHVNDLANGELKERYVTFMKDFSDGDRVQRFQRGSELLLGTRRLLKTQSRGEERLAALDLSILLEMMVTRDLPDVKDNDAGDMVDKLCYLNSAVAGAGYIEKWEYEMSNTYAIPSGPAIYAAELDRLVSHHRKVAEWSASNMTVLFSDVVERYSSFEPIAKSFTDDQIRSTLLLAYGQALSELGKVKNTYSNRRNEVLDIGKQERIRGLNPGYAFGTLEVVEEVTEDLKIDKNKIYVFMYPPADVGPVLGIMTVNEGNVVSHVQLLARNLGIPNAVVSEGNMRDIARYNGEEIFYAVSLSGDVIVKKASEMTDAEQALFSNEERAITSITVNTDMIDLERDSVVNMRSLSGKDSGISCGPKAANLAQLKSIFPDNVVEGLVIPFGVYKTHMDQQMDSRNMTYWEFINQIFVDKSRMLGEGMDEAEVECIVEGELGLLRENILRIDLKEDFKKDLQDQFQNIFQKPLGRTPVFLRSDTNMEDLEDFTGAGLNLTKFNILDEDEIFQGIREVWASPFTARSYKWRQSYLNNPENVYPSILVIPSVNVDYSGVVITKDINNGGEDDMTIAFSRGVGGAVDGQRAETYIIREGKYQELISPSRETKFRTIPPSGGSRVETSQLADPILSYKNMNALVSLVEKAKAEIPRSTEMAGPYDIELGFKDNEIWLFQIRPFVENSTASSSEYLQSISSETTSEIVVDLSKPL